MARTPNWPPYSIGPKDSLFAVGVIGVKYIEIESVTQFMFGTVFGLDMNATQLIFSKIGFEPAIILIKSRLLQLDWPAKTKDAVGHFVAGVCKCNENRNHLSHSQMMFDISEESRIPFKKTDKTVFFKTTKQGKVLAAAPTLEELRAIADDINTFCEYGRQLGNAINVETAKSPGIPVSAFPWPNEPALPRTLEYKSGPIPL